MNFIKIFSHCFFTLKNFAPLRLGVFALILFSLTNAQTLAPDAPGKDAQWATAGKQAVGTSANLESKVWFTLAQGVLTEVYYPDVTVANVHLLQFVVVNPKTKKVETEQDDAVHEIKVLRPDSLTFQQINRAKSGAWKITKTYTTDVERDSILIDVKFEPKNKDLNLYFYYDPSLGNSGLQDTAQNSGSTFVAFDKDHASAMIISSKKAGIIDPAEQVQTLGDINNGFYKISDGLEQLKQNGKLTSHYDKAENGNVVQIGRILKKEFLVVPVFLHQTAKNHCL